MVRHNPLTVQLQHATSEPNSVEYLNSKPDNETRAGAIAARDCHQPGQPGGVGTDNERLLRVVRPGQWDKSRINPGRC
jgi:hypothetical protein